MTTGQEDRAEAGSEAGNVAGAEPGPDPGEDRLAPDQEKGTDATGRDQETEVPDKTDPEAGIEEEMIGTAGPGMARVIGTEVPETEEVFQALGQVEVPNSNLDRCSINKILEIKIRRLIPI